MEQAELVDQVGRRLHALCSRYRVRRLTLFGSAASGAFDPARSDFDLSVEFDPPEGMSLAEQYFGFREEAAALLGRPVDLVERSAVRNPYLRKAIDAEEIVLYAS